MNNLSEIRNLKDINAQRAVLKKKANKQERILLQDLNGLQEELGRWGNRISRVGRIFRIFLPKLEVAGVLAPMLKRFLRKK